LSKSKQQEVVEKLQAGDHTGVLKIINGNEAKAAVADPDEERKSDQAPAAPSRLGRPFGASSTPATSEPAAPATAAEPALSIHTDGPEPTDEELATFYADVTVPNGGLKFAKPEPTPAQESEPRSNVAAQEEARGLNAASSNPTDLENLKTAVNLLGKVYSSLSARSVIPNEIIEAFTGKMFCLDVARSILERIAHQLPLVAE
jgi:hypothetical protein